MVRAAGTLLTLALLAACSKPAAPPVEANAATVEPVAAGGTVPLALSASAPSLRWGPCPPIFTAPGCEIAVLHGDPAKPNADIFLRIPAGYIIPPHRHTSAERMVLVSGELRVRYQGHPAATVATGHYAYGPAGLAHEAACVGGQACTLFIAFEGPVDAEPVSGPLG